MNNKNSSQDFTIKKEFIDLQLELRKFLDEAEFFTLSEILRDSTVVHCLDDYINAYNEQEDLKKIQKTLKKLAKLKKKNINLFPAINELEIRRAISPVPVEDEKISFKNTFSLNMCPFDLKSFSPSDDLTKEKMLGIFKSHLKRFEPLKNIQIPKINITRNFSVSSSHSHLLKKIEKGGESASSPKNGNEIITNSSFRNGIMRNQGFLEKKPKTITSPTPISNSANVVKAMRSPHQMVSTQNPHEALLTPVQKKSPTNETTENEKKETEHP